MTRPKATTPAPTRVTTFELFFDLVFVLTITRLTGIIHHEPDLIGFLTMVLVLANVWWMYSGYGWVTSNTGTSTLTRRVLLFVAMAGFLVMAIAAPNAFGADGLAFGLAYLVIVVVHLGLFAMTYEHGAAREVLQVAPYNLGSAALLIIAGFVEGAADWWLWGAAAALHVVLLEFGRYRSFPLSQAHFVERNGIVLIVALGESMVALGLGIGDHPLSPALLMAAILGLALAAALWTLYFLDADAAAERTLESAPSESRLRIAGLAFSYAFVPLLGGIVMISAALTEVLEHPLAPLTSANAAFLAGGAALYVLGIAAFRQAVGAAGGRRWWASIVAVAACAATFWLGTLTAAVAQVAAVVVVLFALAAVAHLPRRRVASSATEPEAVPR
ncbi:low temperature requirement protein A [Agromyces bauzanensis]